jgi:hypothetical protein
MKHLIAALILSGTANLAFAVHGSGNDDSSTADERASCNASFHAGCPSESSDGSSSTSVAAPAGPLGSTAWEALLVILAAAASLRTNHQRRRPSPQALE